MGLVEGAGAMIKTNSSRPDRCDSDEMKTKDALPVGIHMASTSRELDAIRRLRYAVYVEEEGRTLAGADHVGRKLGDEFDNGAIHLYIEAGGEVVACVRMHIGVIPEALAAPLQLTRFCGRTPGTDCFISKLMVRKDHRGTLAAVRLMRTMCAVCLQYGIQTIFCTTFPHLVALYERVGLHCYTAMYQDKDFGP